MVWQTMNSCVVAPVHPCTRDTRTPVHRDAEHCCSLHVCCWEVASSGRRLCCHKACNTRRQQSRRHPCRQSRLLQREACLAPSQTASSALKFIPPWCYASLRIRAPSGGTTGHVDITQKLWAAQTTCRPLRPIICVMLHALCEANVCNLHYTNNVPCKMQTLLKALFIRNARTSCARKAQSARHPCLAQTNKAHNKKRCAKSAFYNAFVLRRCAWHKKPCRARSAQPIRSQKIPPTPSTKTSFSPCKQRTVFRLSF